jgi:hypothetical protein
VTGLDPKAFRGLLGQRSNNSVDFAATITGHRNGQIRGIRQNNPDGPAVSDLDICRRYYECLGHPSMFPRRAGSLRGVGAALKKNLIDVFFVPRECKTPIGAAPLFLDGDILLDNRLRFRAAPGPTSTARSGGVLDNGRALLQQPQSLQSRW